MKNVSFIQDWIEDGIEQGKKLGKKEGITEGKKLGKKEGKLETLCENITEALLTRFDPSARRLHPLQKQFSSLDNVPTLQQIYQQSLKAQTFDEFAEVTKELLEKKSNNSEIN